MTTPKRDPATKPLTVDGWWDAEYWLYRWFDAEGTLLYVGVTLDPEQRVKNHRRAWWRQWADRCEWEDPIIGRENAFTREAGIVAHEKPIFNRDRNPEIELRMRAYIALRGADPDAYTAHYPKRPRTQARMTRPVEMRTDVWAEVDLLASREGVHRSAWIESVLADHLARIHAS